MKSIFKKIIPTTKRYKRNFYFYLELYRKAYIDDTCISKIEDLLNVKNINSLKSTNKDIDEKEFIEKFCSENNYSEDIVKSALIALKIDLKGKSLYIDQLGHIDF